MAKQLKTQVYSLAFGGDGIGKIDGKVCFVENAVPGDEVVFTVTKETPSYIKGKAAQIVTPSPDRVEAECPHFGRCGGCQYQNLPYEKELAYKRDQAVETIKRISGIKDFPAGEVMPSQDPYHYRSSVTLHKNAKGEYGYYERNSHSIVPIENCPIAENSINEGLEEALAGIKKDEVTVKSDHAGRLWVSERMGDRFFREKFGEIEMFFSPKTFSQCNRFMAVKIAETLNCHIGAVDGDAALFDVYSGAGFFCFMASDAFGLKVGMDIDRVAIDCAKTTAKTFDRKNVKFYRAAVEKEFFQVFTANKRKRNIVLLDPPRAGINKVFLEELVKGGDINELYYISCDPASLGRDIKVITAASNWQFAGAQFFDMFPRTAHIETLAAFQVRA